MGGARRLHGADEARLRLAANQRAEHHPLLRLQRSVGNRAVGVAIQREVETGNASYPATMPAPNTRTQNVADGQAAVDDINNRQSTGNYSGDARIDIASRAGRMRITAEDGGTYKAEIPVTWRPGPAARMDLLTYRWPNMSDHDRQAVASYTSLLRAHEEGHFTRARDLVRSSNPSRIWAFGTTRAEAVRNLQAEANTAISDAATALNTEDSDYDTTTGHGATQDAVGGQNVVLDLS